MKKSWIVCLLVATLLMAMLPATMASAEPPMTQWDGVSFPVLSVVTYCSTLVVHTQPKLDSSRQFTAAAGTLYVATGRVGNFIEIQTEKGIGYAYAAYVWPVASLRSSAGPATFIGGTSLYYAPGMFVAGFNSLGQVLFTDKDGIATVGFGTAIAKDHSVAVGNLQLTLSALNGNAISIAAPDQGGEIRLMSKHGGHGKADEVIPDPISTKGWSETYVSVGTAYADHRSIAVGSVQVGISALNGNAVGSGNGAESGGYNSSVYGEGYAYAEDHSIAVGNVQIDISAGNGNAFDLSGLLDGLFGNRD